MLSSEESSTQPSALNMPFTKSMLSPTWQLLIPHPESVSLSTDTEHGIHLRRSQVNDRNTSITIAKATPHISRLLSTPPAEAPPPTLVPLTSVNHPGKPFQPNSVSVILFLSSIQPLCPPIHPCSNHLPQPGQHMRPLQPQSNLGPVRIGVVRGHIHSRACCTSACSETADAAGTRCARSAVESRLRPRRGRRAHLLLVAIRVEPSTAWRACSCVSCGGE